jgi:hypothetical protein
MLTWSESTNWTTATCSEDDDLANYKDENQKSHKLQGRKQKLAQIVGTKIEIRSNYWNQI